MSRLADWTRRGGTFCTNGMRSRCRGLNPITWWVQTIVVKGYGILTVGGGGDM